MKSLRDDKCRNALIDRINQLSPGSEPLWGRMTVDQMLSHLVQAGQLPFVASVPDRSSFMSRTVIKPLMLYFLPMPKEIKTSPQMDQQEEGRRPLGFEIDKAGLIEEIHKLATLPANHECLPHPFFGKMSVKQWCAISHKHVDHHLRQFGV